MAYKNKEDANAYREANKEKIAAVNKAWEEKNKEKRAAQKKALAESKKDGLYTVYLIVNENYVGMTSDLNKRFIKHKSKGKDVSDVKILSKYKTKREALDVEAGYHKLGYNGKRIYK